MRAVVTGADGFIGSHLCDELERRGWVVAKLGFGRDGAECIDLRDEPKIVDFTQRARPDVVYHLGGVSGPMVAPGDPAEVVSVNCSGTVNVFQAARLAHVPRVVYASSVSGFDGGNERDSYPLTIYGATKRFGEMVAGVYRRDAGVVSVSARIGAVYGKGRRTLDVLDVMLEQARNEGRVSYSPGAVVPLIAVSDVAASLIELGTMHEPPSECDLVTETLTEKVLASMVADEMGLSRASVIAGDAKRALFPEWRRSSYPELLLGARMRSVSESLRDL